jgi:probable rRNA maturation factor
MEPGSRRPGGAPPEGGAVTGFQGSVDIAVVVEAPGWHRVLPRAGRLARRAASVTLAETGCAAAGLTVLLTDDRTMRRLNHAHRGKDKPTNVLSFPGGGAGHLGDLALALGVVRREARAAGRAPAAHFAHLVAHGTLHLLGHDHLRAGEARRMERTEARILHRLGLPNPWRGAAA